MAYPQSNTGTRFSTESSKGKWRLLPVHSALILLVALTLYPFLYMLVSSIKTDAQMATEFWAFIPVKLPIPGLQTLTFSQVPAEDADPIIRNLLAKDNPEKLVPNLHPYNYVRAWREIYWAFPNSFFVTTISCFGVLLLGTLSGYVFARHRFWGKEFLFYMIIALMMVPGILTLIPGFMLVSSLRLVNTYWGVILPYIAGGQIFAIFLFRGYFSTLPEELFEAARLDGAGEMRVLWSLAVPLSLPMIGTVAILNVLGTWNDIIWPLLVLSLRGMRTVTVALLYFERGYRVEEGPLMAGNVIVAIPVMILFLFTMRLFIQGITSGGIKA